MAINAEVERTGSESPASMIRRFSKKVQGTGLVQEVRARRYKIRKTSRLTNKKRALKLLKRRARYEHLFKLGKIIDRPKRGRRGSR